MTRPPKEETLAITIDPRQIPIKYRSVVSNALQAFEQHQFQLAVDLLRPIIDSDGQFQEMWLLLSACYEGLGKNRHARWCALQEGLNYPQSGKAQRMLAGLSVKVNGKFLNLEFQQTSHPAEHPSISLAMIVKNEEQNLAACLESYRDIVDEMIVVDTGSTDRTVEIAKSFGARVEFFPWNDDFAAARNESLKFASCDWILRTDADETIEEPEKVKLLHAVSAGQADVYTCHTVSRVEGIEKDGENVRLIRNHVGIQYEFPLHENVDACAIRLGLTRARTNIFFTHSGYDKHADFEAKITRNVKILEKALLSDPDNYFIRLIYGTALMKNDKIAGLREYEKAVQNLPDDVPIMEYLGEAYCLLAADYAEQRNHEALERIFHNIETDFWFVPSILQFEATLCLSQLGDWKRADKLITWALKQADSSMFADFLSPETYNRNALLSLLFETSVLCKENETALQVYRQQNTEGTTTAADLREASHILISSQEWHKAYQSVLLAAALSELTVQDYCDMAICQSGMNNPTLAHALLSEARRLYPNSALISNMETILAMQENNPRLALEKAVEAFIVEPANANYKGNLEKVAQVNRTNPVQAFRTVGLDWLSRGETQKALFALAVYLKFSPQDKEIQNIVTRFSGQ
jgi:glycosyltransferase involved in cell wall biosynthesis